jgi:hypothetical protein
MRRMRERQRQALEAAPDAAGLRDAADLLAPAVEATIEALELGEQDAAAAQLARQYARTIDRAKDQGWAVRWLAPLLLAALTELGGTPAARAKVKPAQEPPRSTRLDDMRRARRTGPV